MNSESRAGWQAIWAAADEGGPLLMPPTPRSPRNGADRSFSLAPGGPATTLGVGRGCRHRIPTKKKELEPLPSDEQNFNDTPCYQTVGIKIYCHVL